MSNWFREEWMISNHQQRTFLTQLFKGVFEPALILPHIKITQEETEEEEKFLLRLKDFADKHIDGDRIYREGEIPLEIHQGLSDLGIFSITHTEEEGQQGFSLRTYFKALEIIAKHCVVTAQYVNKNLSAGVFALKRFGSTEQQQRWLKPLMSGQAIAAFSFSEPQAGSDLESMETTAIYDPEREIYQLNGEKVWTTFGSTAGLFIVLAKTQEQAISAFLVTPDLPGLEIQEKGAETQGSFRSSSRILLNNTEIPASHLFASEGKGLFVYTFIQNIRRTGVGAICAGLTEYLKMRAVSYAQNRKQFGKPLKDFGLIKQKISMINSLSITLQAVTAVTVSFLEAQQEKASLETALLKIFASETLWKVLFETMQIHGARSLSSGEPFLRIMQDARAQLIGEGTNEVLTLMVAMMGIWSAYEPEQEEKPPIELRDRLWQKWESFNKWIFPTKSLFNPSETKSLCQATRSLGKNIQREWKTYGTQLIEKQLVLKRITSIVLNLYTATCVIGKLRSRVNPSEIDTLLAKYDFHTSLDMIRRTLHGWQRNRDSELERVSDRVTEG